MNPTVLFEQGGLVELYTEIKESQISHLQQKIVNQRLHVNDAIKRITNKFNEWFYDIIPVLEKSNVHPKVFLNESWNEKAGYYVLFMHDGRGLKMDINENGYRFEHAPLHAVTRSDFNRHPMNDFVIWIVENLIHSSN